MSAPSRNFSQELLTRTDDFNHGAAVRSEALNEFAEVLDLALGGGVRAVNNRIGLTAAFGLDQVGVHALAPLTRSGTVLTPVDTKVLMRPILSRQEAEDFIAQLPQLPPEEPESRSMRLLKEFYQQIVTSYDCRRMAGLIRSAVRRRKHALRTGRKVSQMDERYLRRAEDALYGELAAALDLPEEEVLPYIRRTCPQWPE